MKVLVTGPESSGKSTLARNLAWAYDGIYVAEQVRKYLNPRGGHYTEADLPVIWRLQQEAERSAEGSASYVFCDTGPEVIRVWQEVKYGRVSPELLGDDLWDSYDRILLLRPTLPWTYDPLREAPDEGEREKLFERYLELLPTEKVRLVERPGSLLNW